MYKVIHNNQIIDIIDKPKYVKFLYKFNKIIVTDRTNADGIVGSDKKTIYILQGHTCPEGKSYKTVKIKEITEQTYQELKQKLDIKEKVSTDIVLLSKVRQDKVDELNAKCNETITAGLHILLSDGMYHHFKLTIEDQINLANIQYQLSNSNEQKVVYHETGKVCQLFTKADMRTIIRHANEFKNKHTTYFNLMKYCINNMTDILNIQAIQYGDSVLSLNIPESVRQVVKELADD